MKAKIFGSSKSKPSSSAAAADPSSNYHSPLPGHQQRAPSPGYPQAIHAAYPAASTSQSTPERSPSLRQSSAAFAPPPQQHRAPQPIEGGIPPDVLEQRIHDNRTSLYFNQNPLSAGPAPSQLQQHPAPVQEEKHKRGIRDKLGFGHSSKPSQDVAAAAAASSKHNPLGRSLSVSKKRESGSNPSEKYYNQHGQLVDARSPYRRSANSSQNLLNTHTEEDEDVQHNLYAKQQQLYQNVPPQPPAKDDEYEHRYTQQPAPPSAYYQDPRSLARVQTDQTLQHGQAGSLDLRSPNNAQGYPYDDEGNSNPRDSYNAYQPGEDEAAPGTPYQTSPEDAARYSSYSQKPPSYVQHGRIPSGPGHQPELHYPQPGGGASTAGRPSFEQYRPSSQQGHHDARPFEKPNPLFLQAPTRGSSLDQPPSPLVPAGPPPLGGGHPNDIHPPPSPKPPSTAGSAQSSLESMPNQSRSGTSKASAQGGGGGSRESSGQFGPNAPVPPPHKQGVAAFGANTVPAGSQGAPFRGQQPASAAAAAGVAGAVGGQKGRDSPAPDQMAPVELVDEEAASYLQLQKDYKELREKYQKVKKYYFEKEAQVHSLQNTLAHQRLAASRTSLDDSEYAARFSRLDGLISQLAFSIRKSWKAIPEFLHRGVNKEALATGKQEMTAVGKAYMSQWLVTNLFDMYFHPSLELGLSKDLKDVWHNVRKYCPPFQSGEEEEALNAKLVNWRMTTVDGLQDRLRAPEAQQHHARLVEMLNEKMVGDMSLLLADPAPPDLAGGVSMIIELAVAVAQHIPMESRDVSVEYYYPGASIAADMMKVESGIPALTAPLALTETSPSSVGAGDAGDRASVKSTDTRESADPRDSTDGGAAAREEKKARGMFGGLMSGGGGVKVQKQQPPPTSGASANSKSSGSSSAAVAAAGGRETPVKEERVRLCVGISVQIRGRSVLAKASVYGMTV